MIITKSPLAPAAFPSLASIDGVALSVGRAGVKYDDRDDVTLMSLKPGTSVAGVFTQSSMPGAPIDWSRHVLNDHINDAPIGIVVNTGNANVFTGRKGEKTARAMAKAAAKHIGTGLNNVFVASTGVIGEPLDPKPICQTIKSGLMSCDWARAASAIGTTDTFAKAAGRTIKINGKQINIAGIVKGSGMVAPNMATMLGFVFTDAGIGADLLQIWHSEICKQTFNAITVDSDTSTSDMVLLAASGCSGASKISSEADEGALAVKAALFEVMRELAQLVIKDGEGATKFITVNVNGAASERDAKVLAMGIANSPLVKTAIAGEDANWGRVVMAIGKCNARADRDRLQIHFGSHIVAKGGVRARSYDEAVLSAYMQNEAIEITADVGMGRYNFTAWTCDLTHGYISINADYRS